MSTNEEIHAEVLEMKAKLETMDGKLTLLARIDRERLTASLRKVVEKDPMIGRIYLLLDGKRSQKDIIAELAESGFKVVPSGMSTRINAMAHEHGIATLKQRRGRDNIYVKDPAMEKVLNLSRAVAAWLETIDRGTVPSGAKSRRGRKDG